MDGIADPLRLALAAGLVTAIAAGVLMFAPEPAPAARAAAAVPDTASPGRAAFASSTPGPQRLVAPMAAPQPGASAGLAARRQASGAAQPLTLAMSAMPTLQVGEAQELRVAFTPGRTAAPAEIRFTLQFDADVLQVRAAEEDAWSATAAWSAAAPARFVAEVAPGDSRITIHARAGGAASGTPLGPAWLARVQFQAVAPGSTQVMISDVSVRDAAGGALPFVLAASTLPIQALNRMP